MPGMKDLMREYERARFPADRRLDVHGEGAGVARDRALQWIQSRAHEAPGQELLLIVARSRAPGGSLAPVEIAVRKLLEELQGKLIDWWQPFAPGSLALRIADTPRMSRQEPRPSDRGDGRTEATSGSARPSPLVDIPPDLLESAIRAAEFRIEREEISPRLRDVVLREVWIEVQAAAMDRRVTFATALAELVERERERSRRD